MKSKDQMKHALSYLRSLGFRKTVDVISSYSHNADLFYKQIGAEEPIEMISILNGFNFRTDIPKLKSYLNEVDI